jgi:hypothetical protein
VFWFTDGISVVGVAEIPAGGDAVSDELLEFLDVGKAPRSFARPDELALRANVEDASARRDDASSPMSSWNVVSSSCAIQAARRSQRHCVQYLISTRGRLGVMVAPLRGGV